MLTSRSYCFSNQDPFSAFQLWNISTSAFENRYIPLSNKTSWVLDALDGELVLNEVGIHDAGQKWSKSVDGGFSVGGQCLTVDEGSDPEFELPWGSVRDLVMERCIGDAPNQVRRAMSIELGSGGTRKLIPDLLHPAIRRWRALSAAGRLAT
jgi:hypothetical protein